MGIDIKLKDEVAELIKDVPTSEKICISTWGIENAGKSSLLNALTDHIESEYFPTNVVRETITNKTFESEHYIFLDTPGIDSDEIIEKDAYKGLNDADIILFVHQPQGELHQQEINLLKHIHGVFGDSVKDRLIIVLTLLDKSENNSLNQIQDAVMLQCEKLLNFVPTCFQVSNTRYQQGSLKKNSTLQKKSGIPELKDYIDLIRPVVYESMSDVRAEKKKIQVENLLQKFERKIGSIEAQISEIQKPYVETFTLVNSAVSDMKKFHSKTMKQMEKLRE